MSIHRIKKSVASRIANSSAKKMMPKRVQVWAVDHIDFLTATNSNTISDNSDSRNNTPDSDSTAFEVLESSSSSLPVLELNLDRTTKMTTRSCLKKTKQSPARPKQDTHENYKYNIYSVKDNHGREKHRKRVAFLPDASLMTCMRTGMHLLPEVKTAETVARFLERSERCSFEHAAYKAVRRLEHGTFPDSDSQSSDSVDEAQQDEDDDVEAAEDEDDRITRQEKIDQMGPFDAEEQAITDLLQRARDNAEAHAAATVAGGGMDFALYVARTEEHLASLVGLATHYCAAYAVKIACYPRTASEWRHVSHGEALGRASGTRLAAADFEDYENSMAGGRALMRALLLEATIKTPSCPPVEVLAPPKKEKDVHNKDNSGRSGSGDVTDLIMPTASLSLDPVAQRR